MEEVESKSKKQELNYNQERFAVAFSASGNRTQAAIEAGYSLESANSQGSRLLAKAKVMARVLQLQEDSNALAARAGITKEWVVREWVKIARTSVVDVVDISSGTPRIKTPLEGVTQEQYAMISEVGVTAYGLRVKMYSKERALESIARYLAMFDDTTTTKIIGELVHKVERTFIDPSEPTIKEVVCEKI